MFRVITVEREYGSQGAEFAQRLAERLKWKFIDGCLIEAVAEKAGVPRAMVESCDERSDPWYYRMGKTFWHGSVEGARVPLPLDKVFDSERMVDFVRSYLKECSQQCPCVIVGRGAACALVSARGVFNVFVYASMRRKVKWFEQQFPEDGQNAKYKIEATDHRRSEYVRRYYNQDWTDRRLYHLMINSCLGSEAMVSATIDAAGLVRKPTGLST